MGASVPWIEGLWPPPPNQPPDIQPTNRPTSNQPTARHPTNRPPIQINCRRVRDSQANVFEGLSRQPQFGVILAAEAALQVGGCSWRSLLAVQQSSEAAADRAAQSCIQQHAPHVLGVEPTTPNSTPKPKP